MEWALSGGHNFGCECLCFKHLNPGSWICPQENFKILEVLRLYFRLFYSYR